MGQLTPGEFHYKKEWQSLSRDVQMLRHIALQEAMDRLFPDRDPVYVRPRSLSPSEWWSYHLNLYQTYHGCLTLRIKEVVMFQKQRQSKIKLR